MNYPLLSLILLTSILSSNSLLEDEYFEINDFDGLLFNDKEFEIHNENIKISIPNDYIFYKIQAKLKGDSEFLYSIKNSFLKDNINEEETFNKAKEKSFILDANYSNIFLNEEKQNSIYINIKNPEEHKVILKIQKLTEDYNSLFHDVTEEYCTNIKNNIKGIMEDVYIYLDYAKNPKQPAGFPNYFKKVDFTTALDNIQTKNRKFYDFYRDIKELLGKYQDYHLDIRCLRSSQGISLSNSYAFLPFLFYIKEDSGIQKLYIKEGIFFHFSQKILKKI